MIKGIQNIHPAFFVLVATSLEVSGDTIAKKCIYKYSVAVRIVLFAVNGLLLFGYRFFLNLVPTPFGQVAELYIVMLFIVFQIVNYVAFQTLPTLPVVVCGVLVISGGRIVAFRKP